MTSTNMEKILQDFRRNPRADPSVARQLEERGIRLPSDYLSFLQREANGGEGFIGPNAHVILWRVEELAELNDEYEVSKYAPGLFLFGSDGGGEAFAFDMRTISAQIVTVPFVGMNISLARPMAGQFSEFLEAMYAS